SNDDGRSLTDHRISPSTASDRRERRTWHGDDSFGTAGACPFPELRADLAVWKIQSKLRADAGMWDSTLLIASWRPAGFSAGAGTRSRPAARDRDPAAR